MAVDEVLIAAELGGMIAADALVEIACAVGAFVKGFAFAQVEHTEVGILVGQNLFVGRRGVDGAGLTRGQREEAVVEVALVDLPEVEEAQHGEADCHDGASELAAQVEPKQAGTHQNDEKRAQGVGAEHTVADGGDGVGVACDKIGRENAREFAHGVGLTGRQAVAGHAGEEP